MSSQISKKSMKKEVMSSSSSTESTNIKTIETPSFMKRRKKRLKETKKEKNMDHSEDECIEEEPPLEAGFPQDPAPTKKDANQFKVLDAMERVEQRSEIWYKLRKGMLTASDWASCLGEGCSGKPEDIILKKCDQGEPFTGNAFTDWGTKYEAVATRIYELRTRVKVYEFGVLQHPKYPFLGASPDGITKSGIMLEIKCPMTRKITGIVPRYYWIQIQGQLEVCDLNLCDFLECSLAEYPNIETYLEDTEENPPKRFYKVDKKLMTKYKKGDVFNRTKEGMEKGAVLTYLDEMGDKKYFYSECGVSENELRKWEKSVEKKADPRWTKMRIAFWRLNHFSCVRVERERDWFAEARPKLEDLWNQIEHYRKVGCESILAKKKKKPKSGKEKIVEPSTSDMNMAIQNTSGLDDLMDDYLFTPSKTSKEIPQKEVIVEAAPAPSHVDHLDDFLNEPVKEYELIDPDMGVIQDEVKLSTHRVATNTPKVDVTELSLDLPELEKSSPPADIELYEAFNDLEMASLLLPKYLPLEIENHIPDSITRATIALAGIAKTISRSKTALVRLVKKDSDLSELPQETPELVRRINFWMVGIAPMLQDYLLKFQVQLSEEIVQHIQNTMETCDKWNTQLYPKFQQKMAQPSTPRNDHSRSRESITSVPQSQIVTSEEQIKKVTPPTHELSSLEKIKKVKKQEIEESKPKESILEKDGDEWGQLIRKVANDLNKYRFSE